MLLETYGCRYTAFGNKDDLSDIIIILRQLSGPIRYGGIELAQNGFEPVAQVAQC